MRALAFVALGSSEGDPPAHLAEALRRLENAGERIAAVAPAVLSPFEDAAGHVVADSGTVLNSVAELRTERKPRELLALLHEIEAALGRTRGDDGRRTLDLDLLALGEPESAADLQLPHPRAVERAFVLRPWAAIAPAYEVPGTGETVLRHEAHRLSRHAAAFDALDPQGLLELPEAGHDVRVLENASSLAAWRDACGGTVGVVPTMGALHDGHESLVRRARAECDHVLITLFVNPLQFGEGEDLERYPRTWEGDLARLGAAGADAVYAPVAEDLYPPGFATYLTPDGPALGLEGDVRPGHFRGVATVVYLLWRRTRPDRAYFGQKDAQQLAVLRRMARDLGLGGEPIGCPTVRETDGLALSSRNRYLAPDERARAVGLSRALRVMARNAACGESSVARLKERGREILAEVRLDVDYLEVVDPDTMSPAVPGLQPVLAVGAVRLGSTRLIDNRWLVSGRER